MAGRMGGILTRGVYVVLGLTCGLACSGEARSMKLGASALERRYAVTPPRYPVLTDDIDLTTPA